MRSVRELAQTLHGKYGEPMKYDRAMALARDLASASNRIHLMVRARNGQWFVVPATSTAHVMYSKLKHEYVGPVRH